MSTITTKDGRQIHYKDWGKGPILTFSHGWPLNSDACSKFSKRERQREHEAGKRETYE